MKKPKKRRGRPAHNPRDLTVKWEPIADEESEEALTQAFEMIFREPLFNLENISEEEPCTTRLKLFGESMLRTHRNCE